MTLNFIAILLGLLIVNFLWGYFFDRIIKASSYPSVTIVALLFVPIFVQFFFIGKPFINKGASDGQLVLLFAITLLGFMLGMLTYMNRRPNILGP